MGRPRSAARAALFVLAAGAATACRRDAPARVFVTNEDSGDVSIIDSARDEVIATIPVGSRPRGLRVSPDGKLLYVAVTGSPKGGPGGAPSAPPDAEARRDPSKDGIVVVDIERRAVARMIPAGTDPESFDVTADGKTLFVSNEDDAAVARVDVGDGKVVRTTPVGAEPEGVAIRPDGKVVYVASEAASEIDVLDAVTGALVTRVPTERRPRSIVFGPRGQRALVTAELGGVVHVLDANQHVPVGAPIRTGTGAVKPMGVALSPDGSRAWVTNGREGSVAVIDLVAQRLERTIDHVGARPWGIALTPDGKKLYVAAGPDVAVIDAATGNVTKRLAVGKGPWGVAVGAAR